MVFFKKMGSKGKKSYHIKWIIRAWHSKCSIIICGNGHCIKIL